MARDQDEQFTVDETQRRFETLLRAAVTTPPQPLKDMPKKRAKTKPKTKRARDQNAR
jgi:hypothetical protein